MNAHDHPDDSSRTDGVVELEAILERVERQLATAADRQRLNALLTADASCRATYVAWMQLQAGLAWHFFPAKPLSAAELQRFDLAGALIGDESSPGEMAIVEAATCEISAKSQKAAPSLTAPVASPVLGFLGGVVDYVSHSRMVMFWLLFAALTTFFTAHFAVLLLGRFWAENAQVAHNQGAGKKLGSGTTEQRDIGSHEIVAGKIVARLTDAVDCHWGVSEMQRPSPQPSPIRGEGAAELAVGAELSAGQQLDLTAGLAEITFDSGAKVILNAPSRFIVSETLGGNLQFGKLTARVPHTAIGFAVDTPGGKVVDKGTEFGVKVNLDRTMHVIVYVGEVEVKATPGSGSGGSEQPAPVRVKAGEAVVVTPGQSIKSTPPENERFVRDLAPLGDPAKAEAAYVELIKKLKPVVWFRMEGKAADRELHDEMGGRNAKLSWDGPGNPFVWGKFGKSLWLRGPGLADGAAVDDYPKAEHGKISVVAWVYADSRPAWASIVKNWGTNNEGQFIFGLCSKGNEPGVDLSVTLSGISDLREGESHPFPLYEWQHVAFTCGDGMLRLYRQGREVAWTKSPGVKFPSRVRALGIGVKTDDEGKPGLYGWDGKLDEVAIFNDMLAADDIRALANSSPR